MDAKKFEVAGRRLSSEYQNLIKSINRSRLAAEEIKLQNTEDEGEGDLDAISHERELLYHLRERRFRAFVSTSRKPLKQWTAVNIENVSVAATHCLRLFLNVARIPEFDPRRTRLSLQSEGR
jgi:hypothetical protein